ncbi:MAG: hypothetical protein MR888_07720 [Clostridiales bacterium]|nr:hypothetical protein [Clostridiales bacterium]
MDAMERLDGYLRDSCGNADALFHFLRFECPELIADIGRAHDFLQNDLPEDYKRELLAAVCYVKMWMEKERPHTAGTAGGDGYESYLVWKKRLEAEGVTQKLARKDFRKVFDFTHRVELDSGVLGCVGGIFSAIGSLTEAGETREHILEYIHILVNEPGKARRIPQMYAPERCDRASREKMFDGVLQKLGKSPTYRADALCAAYLNQECNDILAENCVVYYLFTSTLPVERETEALVVAPTPFFVRQWMRDSDLSNVRVTFLMENRLMADICRGLPWGKYAQFIAAEDMELYLGRNGAPKNTLLFGSRIPDVDDYIGLLKENLKSGVNRLSYFGADASSREEIRGLLTGEDSRVTQVHLFPDGINFATSPQRKLLVSCEYGYIQKSRKDMVSVFFYGLDRTGEKQYLSRKSLRAQIPVDRLTGGQSFRSAYRAAEMAYLSRTDGRRNHAVEYPFSAEIKVCLTASANAGELPRVEAYVRAPDAEKGGNGKRIEESIKRSRVIPMEALEKWATEEYPYARISRKGKEYFIREIVAEVYRKAYAGRPVSLKTLAYIYPDWVEELPQSGKKCLQEILTALGEYLTTDITPQLAGDALERLYGEAGVQVRRGRRVLGSLMETACAHGHCGENTVRELLREEAGDGGTYDVSRNLTKKSLTKDEMQRIFADIRREYEAGNTVCLGSLVCLLMGLESNVACALRWRDFTELENYTLDGEPVYQIRVSRQLQNDGKAYRRFEKVYHYATLPCPKLLSDILLTERRKQRTKKNEMEEAAFLAESIVQGENMVWVDDRHRVVAPGELSRINRQFIKKAGISDQLIEIPTDGKGTVESNLAYYRGDLFRANFKHYGLLYCRYDPGELAYLLRTKGPDTYARNYCDYANAKLQLILAIKQRRWLHWLLHEESEMGMYTERKGVAELTYKADRACGGLSAVITPRTKNGELRITLENTLGFCADITRMEGEKNDGSI